MLGIVGLAGSLVSGLGKSHGDTSLARLPREPVNESVHTVKLVMSYRAFRWYCADVSL